MQSFTISIRYVLAIIFFMVFSIESKAQQPFYYFNSQKIQLTYTTNMLLVKFRDGSSESLKKNVISNYRQLMPLTDSRILNVPDVCIVETNGQLNEEEIKNLCSILKNEQLVEYANPFLLFEPDSTLQGITDRFVLKLKPGYTLTDIQKLCNLTGTKVVDKDSYTEGIYILKVSKNTAGNALEMANYFYETGMFEFSEPDFLRLLKPLASVNDNYFAYQWALKNTGSSIQYSGTVEADMDVDNAWDISTGSPDIRVAIIDEGVDLTHPDLISNLVAGYDGTGQGSHGGPSGNDAHGTNCAGIVGATGNNSIGVAGIAYKCKIVPVRIAYGSGSGWVTSNTWIANSINWSWDSGRADVLSNSWGGGSSSSLINTAIDNAQTNGRNGLGCVVLFAAGNSNGNVIYPGSLSNVISVAAMSMCYQRKSPTSCDNETNWGSCYGTNLDVAAPGVKIAATDISGTAGYRSGDYNLTFNGTSSACPNAAGVVALMLSENPNLTHTQAREILEKTCQKVGSYTYSTVTGHPNGSWCNDLGYGMVNAFEAVKEAMIYATIPYLNGFENGIDKYWEFENTTTAGRIQTSTAYSPHTGNYHLLMDVSTNNQPDTNKAKLKLNLDGKHKVKMSFWWKSYNDEYNSRDGIYLSNNKGQTWTKIYNLNSTTNTYQQVFLDISKITDSLGITLTDKTVIKFQHYDDSSLTNDGFAFDDIYIAGSSADLTVRNAATSSYNIARDSFATISCRLHNIGSWPTDSSTISFYLSYDSIYHSGDVLLKSVRVGKIKAADSLTVSTSVRIPLNSLTGKAYILYYADAANEITDSIESNNIVFKEINIISYPPVITSDPVPVKVLPGDNFTLNVIATGAATLNYQWQKNGTQINGATASTFYKKNASYNDSGYYRCIVSNTYGKDTSNYAFVRVSASLNMCDNSISNALNGNIYDPGGAGSNYTDELNCGLLIKPDCADSIKLTFSSFNLELNYDYLKVYDGIDQNGTLLLNATGTTLPSSVVATSGSMYLLFTSDAYVTAPGFSAAWTTVKTNLSANFGINDSSQCLRANSFTFSNSSTINSGSYTNLWKFGDNTTSSSTSPNKTFSAPGTYSIKLLTTSSKGCKDSISKNVHVRPHPSSVFSFSDTSQCFRGNNFSFSNQSTIQSGTFSNTWKFGDNTTSTLSSPSKTYNNQGIYNVWLITNSGYNCKDSSSKTAYVRPQPQALFTVNDSSQCFRTNAFVFTNQSNIASGSLSYNWNFADNSYSSSINPSKTYSNPGNYSVKLNTISNFNCTDSLIKAVYVRPQPVAAFTINDSSACYRNNSFTFTNTSTISSGSNSYLWKMGDNSTSTVTSPVKSYSSSGIFGVKLIATSAYGCKDSVRKNVYVRAQPFASFQTNDSTQCLRGNMIQFTNLSVIGAGTFTNTWQFGDLTSSTLSSPAKTYSSDGIFTVTLKLVSDYNCTDSMMRSVYIYPHPVSQFSVNDTAQCFSGNFFHFNNNSSLSSGNFSSLWHFGDNSSSQSASPDKMYTVSGIYQVKLVTTSNQNCKDSILKNVYVWPQPHAGFSVNDSMQCKKLNSFNFTNTSTISSGSYLNYWFFGDQTTSNAQSPVKIYSSPGNYQVKLKTTSSYNCSDSTTKNITVWPDPEAGFVVNNSVQCHRNNYFDFVNTSQIISGFIYSFWDFGDKITSNLSSPKHSYQNIVNDTIPVRLIETSDNGCSDTIEQNMVILPTPTASFSIDSSRQCLRGNKFNLSNLSSFPSGSGIALWKFGDGKIDAGYNSIHSYLTPGTYKIDLFIIADQGCTDSTYQTVVVLPQPLAAFKISDTSVCLKNNLILFTDASTVQNDTIVSIKWNFGDGSMDHQQIVSHSFAEPVLYKITDLVTTASGCTDSAIGYVKVNPMPVSSFLVNNSMQCKQGNSFFFKNTSEISQGKLTYSWKSSDGFSSTDTHLTHSYSMDGDFMVSLQVSSAQNCTDEFSKDITVYPSPAVFLGNDTQLFDYQGIELDAGGGFDSYLWSDASTTRKLWVDTNGNGLSTQKIWVNVQLGHCSATDSIQISFKKYVSADDLNIEPWFSIYPNPVSGELYIETDHINGATRVRLFDARGKLVNDIPLKSDEAAIKQLFRIDFSTLPRGIYILNVISASKTSSVRIMKN